MSMIDAKLHRLLNAIAFPEVMIFANQNAPRPELPYWTILPGVHRRVGSDQYGQDVDAAGNLTVEGVRELTVTVQRIGKDSDMYVADMRDELSLVTQRERWMYEKLSLYNMADVLNVPYEMDDNHLEARASLDLFVRFGTRLYDLVGIIEIVEVDAEYCKEGLTPDPDLSDTIVTVLP